MFDTFEQQYANVVEGSFRAMLELQGVHVQVYRRVDDPVKQVTDDVYGLQSGTQNEIGTGRVFYADTTVVINKAVSEGMNDMEIGALEEFNVYALDKLIPDDLLKFHRDDERQMMLKIMTPIGFGFSTVAVKRYRAIPVEE